MMLQNLKRLVSPCLCACPRQFTRAQCSPQYLLENTTSKVIYSSVMTTQKSFERDNSMLRKNTMSDPLMVHRRKLFLLM